MTTKHSDVHQYIESTFGSDIKSLKNIKEIYEESLKKKQTLEQQVIQTFYLYKILICTAAVVRISFSYNRSLI